MKITILLVLVLSFGASASIYSQNQRVSMQFEDATILEVLNEIKSQTGLRFIYNEDKIEGLHDINLDAGDKTVEEVLTEIFEETDLECRFQDDVIMIVDRMPEAVIQGQNQEQEKEIKGKVTDEQGVPLPGVSVVVKGTNIGVATNIDGEYSLEFDQENVVLVFSFVGMSSKEIAYNGQSVLNVTLGMDTEQMAEVVVTGYQTISKERATGSFKVLDSDDVNHIASLDVIDKLEGVAAGVKVGENGEITIRGKGSIYAGTQPLYVVDGIPWVREKEFYSSNSTQSPLTSINPDDIESITVLKDAASTAIYGVRGANGVIVITTKKGQKDSKLRVNYSGTLLVDEKVDLSKMNLMNTAEHVDLEWESYDRIGLGYGSDYKSEVGEIFSDLQDGDISQEEATGRLNTLKSYNNQKDIEKYFFQRAFTQKHTLSFDYGTEKNQFYASISFDEEKFQHKGNENRNVSFSLNDTYKFNKVLTLRLNARGNFERQKMNGNSSAALIRPYVRFFDDNGNYLDEARGFDKEKVKQYEERGLIDFSYNQVQERRLKDNTMRSNTIATNAHIDLKPFEFITWTSSVGYNVTNRRIENLKDKYSYGVRSLVNQMTSPDLTQNIPWGHILEYGDYYTRNLTLRSQIDFKKELGDFYITASAGLERNSFIRENNTGNVRYNYHPDRLTENRINLLQLSQGIPNAYGRTGSIRTSPRASGDENRYQSVYYIGGLTYKNKYDLTGSWRMDKTNLFGTSSKYRDQPAWSLGAKWSISAEEFFNVDFINNLALKLSYGKSGNVDKDTSPYVITYPRGEYWIPVDSQSISNPANPLLSWESTYMTNIALEFSLFNNRIYGGIEYYRNHSKDLLANVNMDSTVGFGDAKVNFAELVNNGVDINIGARLIDQKKLKYDVNLNFSYNHNEVTKVSRIPSTKSELLGPYAAPTKGKPLGYLYGYKNAGVDNNGEPFVYNRSGETVSADNMGDLDIEDLIYFGSKNPPVYGSLTNTLTLGKFTASAFITYDLGHYMSRYDMYTRYAQNSHDQNLADHIVKRWMNPGDEEHTNFARLNNTFWDWGDRAKAYYYSDANIKRADIIRLKSINFSYDFTSLLKSKVVTSLRVRAGIENLWQWSATGDDRYYLQKSVGNDVYYPNMKRFTFGVNIGL